MSKTLSVMAAVWHTSMAALVFFLATASTAAAQTLAENWQLGMSDPATIGAERLNSFHDLLLIIITLITIFVLALLLYVMFRFNAKRNPTPSTTTHHVTLEVVWTAVPVLILLVIAFPSFSLLYFLDKAEDPEMTVIARGYQWYWGYELPDQQIGEFQAYMVEEEDLTEDQVRLLSTTDPLILPVDTTIQVLVTAGDVLHAWAMPNFGVKTDAIPGTMNETWIRIDEEGTYYGQCSEICGTGHGFMPIEVRAISREAFDDWVVEQTAGLDLETPPVLLTREYPGTESDPVQQAALNDN